ncbi:MAG: AAA family ATPase [Defluviitaleaceae bacterium]|nr:AAA family ATPase [Defluviitaleaceae bacterium]
MTPRELTWQELKFFYEDFELEKKAEEKDNLLSQKLIGQPRASQALRFGLQMKDKAYHIYVTGQTGTGRTTFAKSYAAQIAATEATPPDLCYVYNFANPKCPKLMTLPPGTGQPLKDSMIELMNRLTSELPKTFTSKDHETKKNEVIDIYKNKRDDIIKEMTEEARTQDFGVKNTSSGIYFMPIVDGEVISEEQYEALSQEEKDSISENSVSIQKRAAEVMRKIRDYDKRTKKAVEELEYSLALFTVGHHMNDIIQEFAHESNIHAYLKDVKEDILENIAEFLAEDAEEEEAMQTILPWYSKKSNEDILTRYKVNLVTNNAEQAGAPVVVDYNPSHTNLVGEIEYDNEFGNFSTDFMKIKPGLLHRANGGYLILQAQDVLGSPHAWETLRRSLITGQIVTEPLREYNTGVAVSGIKPEPIPLDVKIILVGGGFYYDLLWTYDDYFEKLFKVRVDFDYEMKLNHENMMELSSYVKAWATKENSLPFEDGAISRLIEYAARLAERKDRLTTRFNRLSEILAEATAWARIDSESSVSADHIKKAIEKRNYRLNMYEEKLSDLIEEDSIMISTQGTQVGQINGLAVLDTGDYAFAKPSRITATVYMGKAGIVNIEKEAEMSGQIHDKGVQVIIGYLGQTYAQDFPLTLSCRICFEQNYSGIDGDSASSTELFAILSALTGLPIRQDIAVTGSMNQHGEIQPIGGTTFKIEGFFDLCSKRGLTGTQGVIIPARNIRDLVLKDEVIEAVRDGKFHIYPISHVDEGIEILMSLPAGDGSTKIYPYDTVHGKAYRKLRSYHRKAMKE